MSKLQSSLPKQCHMQYKFLGNTGLLVSSLSFGSWVTFGTQTDVQRSYELMLQAYKAGINFFDNAEIYANGESEKIMGKVVELGIKNNDWTREDLVISTKIFFGDGSNGPNQQGLSRKHIIEGTRNSLQRLNMKYVDLIFCHRPDPYTPMEEIVRAMNFIINQGYAFYWGTSEWEAHEIIQANEIAKKLHLIPPHFDQTEYNIFNRDKVDNYYNPLYDKYKYGLTIWSPLASGVLTGKYSGGKIPQNSRLSLKEYGWLKDKVLHNADKADRLKPIADKLNCSMAQLAIAWCLSKKEVSTVILGATSVEQLNENLKSLHYVNKITREIKEEIDKIVQYQYMPVVENELVKNIRTQYYKPEESGVKCP